MIRVVKTKFIANKVNLERLYKCNRVSGEIWNNCLKLSKEYYQKTDKWITKTELQKCLKKKYNLHSQSVQSVAHKYLNARLGAKHAIEKGYKTRYPYKEKNNFPTKWAKDGFSINEDGQIKLSMGVWEGKRQKPIYVQVKKLEHMDTVKEIELIWDNGLWLAISYDNGKIAIEKSAGKLAAIDMGEIHTIAATQEFGEAIIITGRKLRSIKRLRNKKHKELSKKLARTKKGSRRFHKLKRAKTKVSSKTKAIQKDILHKTSRQFVNWAIKNDIKKVVVGDVEGVQRNTSTRNKNNPKKKRRRKIVSQKLSQWSFGLLLTYLQYKLAEFGIELIKDTEEYTSQTCPVCNRRKKVSGRVYKCYCGYSQHRDIHGARNILTKYKYGKICDGGIKITTVKYLRPAS